MDIVERFRPPWTAWVWTAAILVVIALVFINVSWVDSGFMWTYVIVFLTVLGLGRWRQGLACHPDHLAVTVLRTRRIPWQQIQGIRPGSNWRGGIRIQISTGQVWSPAPASWWGGPASEEDVARLRGIAAARLTV